MEILILQTYHAIIFRSKQPLSLGKISLQDACLGYEEGCRALQNLRKDSSLQFSFVCLLSGRGRTPARVCHWRHLLPHRQVGATHRVRLPPSHAWTRRRSRRRWQLPVLEGIFPGARHTDAFRGKGLILSRARGRRRARGRAHFEPWQTEAPVSCALCLWFIFYAIGHAD